jgi:replicative DNA helicase
MQELTYIPPNNRDAEMSFLCACLMENRIIRTASVRAEDFYYDRHRAIWKIMQDLMAHNMPVDIITIADKVKLESGIATTAAEISAYGYPTAANWKTHEKLILEASLRRQVIHLMQEALQSARSEQVDRLIHNLRLKLSSIAGRESSNILEYKNIISETFDIIERRVNAGDVLSGVTTGFRDMDRLTDGWQNADLIIFAGRPSMGKTAYVKIGATAAARQGISVGMIHLEMSKTQLGIRAIAGQSDISISKLRRGIISESDWPTIINACSELSTLPIYLEFAAYTDRQISRAIDNLVLDKGVKIIYLDYLQLATSEDAGKNREQEISGISRMLKLKAKELNIPIIALAQLNRQCEMRADKRPMMADLRDSGGIEQDADVIAFVYRDEVYHPHSEDRGIAEIIFRKGRQIELDTVRLQWHGPTTTYRDLAPESHYAESPRYKD